MCYAERDKMLNVLEVGGIQDFAKDKPIDLQLNEIYLGSDLFNKKSDVEKYCCFACQRTIQNSKEAMVNLLPQQFHDNMKALKEKNE